MSVYQLTQEFSLWLHFDKWLIVTRSTCGLLQFGEGQLASYYSFREIAGNRNGVGFPVVLHDFLLHAKAQARMPCNCSRQINFGGGFHPRLVYLLTMVLSSTPSCPT